MNAAILRAKLSGGDRRSIGRADEVAADVRANPAWFGAVFAAIFDEDELVRMRSADAVEKITALVPELLRPWKAEFLARLPDLDEQEVRWHAAQLLPRFELTREERDTVALPALRSYLHDKSRIVQTFALQALADFAAEDAQLRPEVVSLIEQAVQTGSAAVRSRARRLLAQLDTAVKPPTDDGAPAPQHRPRA